MASPSPLHLWALLLAFVSLAAAQNNVMFSGQRLLTDDRLAYGGYNFIMQGDCNLVLYGGNWQSDTSGNGRSCQLVLHEDGSLGIVDGDGRDVWISGAKGSRNGEYVAVLHPDGKVVVHGPAVWSTRSGSMVNDISGTTIRLAKTEQQADNLLFSGQTLNTDNELKTGIYHFVVQGDCNLVLYNGGWQSDTSGHGRNCFLRLDHNGELAVKDDSYNTVWSNGVRSASGEYVAVLRPDGQVVVYGPDIWSTSESAGVKLTNDM